MFDVFLSAKSEDYPRVWKSMHADPAGCRRAVEVILANPEAAREERVALEGAVILDNNDEVLHRPTDPAEGHYDVLDPR